MIVPVILPGGNAAYLTSTHDLNNYLRESDFDPRFPIFIQRAIDGAGPAEFSRNCVVNPSGCPTTLAYSSLDDEPQYASQRRKKISFEHAGVSDLVYRDVVFKTIDVGGKEAIMKYYTAEIAILENCGRISDTSRSQTNVQDVNKALLTDDDYDWEKLRATETITVEILN
jgi:hypothetical protein